MLTIKRKIIPIQASGESIIIFKLNIIGNNLDIKLS